MTAPTTRLPRLVVAAPSTGSGKTTVTTGLIAALTRRGLEVSGHKVGPDYIDPGYHALACGRPGRNLDAHLCGPDAIVPLLLHGACTPRPADVAVVEGVMGLYDGKVGTDGFSSTAHVAALTRSPVVLVVDVSRSSRSLGAVVHGMATWDPTVDVVAVVLNQVSSPRMVEEVRRAMPLPVLGALPRDAAVSAPSRHLGLVPAAERDLAAEALDQLAAQVEAHVDLDAVLDVARSAPALAGEPWDPARALRTSCGAVAPTTRTHDVPPAGRGARSASDPIPAGRGARSASDEPRDPATCPGRPVVAVAGGRAFTFRYAETEELLRAAGCEPVAFDPLHDPELPPGTRGIYLGGGFPEVHAADLTGNAPLRRELADTVRDGVPTVAECAGLLYLARSLDGSPMVGAVTADAAMHDRLTLRYPEAVAAADTLLTRVGERVTGHEFHRTRTTPGHGAVPAWEIDGAPEGFAGPTLHASYLHTHWAGHPQLAGRFADAVHAHA